MQISAYLANPGGNITLLVLDAVSPEARADLAKRLMALPGFAIEQVGYVTDPVCGGDTRLEMMGGELCGNATRSLGYLEGCLRGKRARSLRVECSGVSEPLEVELDYERETAFVRMAPPLAVTHIDFSGERFPVVCFDGIAHMIVAGERRAENFVLEAVQALHAQTASAACGVMFLWKEQLVPAVWVRETGSLVWEGSCGSGSLACAVWRALTEGREKGCFHQPGGMLETRILRKNGVIRHCIMGGAVTLSGRLTLTVE